MSELYYVAEQVAEEMGNKLFFTSGSLLGQVRTGGWIPGDDDLDTAYVSKLWPKHARRELVEMALLLNQRGYDAHVSTPMNTHLHVHHPLNHQIRIDVFFYLDTEDGIIVPSGVASEEGFLPRWDGVESAEFANIFGHRPKQAEELVAHIFGDDWRTPMIGDQWHWGNRMKRSWPEYALTWEQVVEVENARPSEWISDHQCEKR